MHHGSLNVKITKKTCSTYTTLIIVPQQLSLKKIKAVRVQLQKETVNKIK